MDKALERLRQRESWDCSRYRDIGLKISGLLWPISLEADATASLSKATNTPNAPARNPPPNLRELQCHKRLQELIDVTLQNMETTREISDWAHTIRHLGNDAAHANECDPSEQEAKQAYEVVRLMLDLLFAYPVRIRDLRQSRQ